MVFQNFVDEHADLLIGFRFDRDSGKVSFKGEEIADYGHINDKSILGDVIELLQCHVIYRELRKKGLYPVEEKSNEPTPQKSISTEFKYGARTIEVLKDIADEKEL